MQLCGVVLVEGASDRRAVETLARRRGRDLQAEGVAIVPMGGYGNLPRLLAEQGELRAFRTYQKQPAHRARPLEEQLHGFMWNRKQKYAVLLVEALDLEHVPRPLDRVLAHFSSPARD